MSSQRVKNQAAAPGQHRLMVPDHEQSADLAPLASLAGDSDGQLDDIEQHLARHVAGRKVDVVERILQPTWRRRDLRTLRVRIPLACAPVLRHSGRPPEGAAS